MSLSLGDVLQSTFVLLSLLSDYFLLFDQYILTLCFPARASWEKGSRPSRWRSAMHSCLAYAVLETLWYRFMTSISDSAVWWLLMAALTHLAIGMPGFLLTVTDAMQKVKQAHERRCIIDGNQIPEEQPYRDNDNAHGQEREIREPPTPEIQGATASSDQQARWSSLANCGTHSPPLAYRLAPLIPMSTTAATNAALLFYTRYLSSRDSRRWEASSLVGWSVIASLCLGFVAIAKYENVWFEEWREQSRRKREEEKKEREKKGRSESEEEEENESGLIRFLWKFGNLGLLVLARAALRWIAGQDRVAFPCVESRAGDGGSWRLALHSDVHIGDIWTDPAGPGSGEGFDREHLFDRVMSRVPWWAGHVANAINLGVMAWYFGWGRKREARKEKEEEKGEGAAELKDIV